MTNRALHGVGLGLLLLGLLAAFVSQHYASKTMGQANYGVAVLAPEEDSAEWQQKVRLRQFTDAMFYAGLAMTALGILVQGYATLRTEGGVVNVRRSLKGGGTWLWITATATVVAVTITLSWLYNSDSYLSVGEIGVLAFTAISLFLYARDTRRIADITFEQHHLPLATLSVRQVEMNSQDVACPMALQLARPVPFIARIDIRLQIGGKLVPLENHLYDGEEDWVILASFENLPARLMDAINRNLPGGIADVEQLLAASAADLPEDFQSEPHERISVSPLILYGTDSRACRLASAGKSYLKLIRPGAPNAAVMWMPDVARGHYLPMEWSKGTIEDFYLG